MCRMNTSHMRNERTRDHRDLASPALVTWACVSLVLASVPLLPQRLAATWGWSAVWSWAGHCRTVSFLGRWERAAGLLAGESSPED